MEQQALYTEQAQEKPTPVRAAFRSAADTLKRGELLLHMTLCTLFVLLAFVAAYYFSAGCANLVEDYTVLSSYAADAVYRLLWGLLTLFFVLPLLLGRLHMAAMAQEGLCPLPRELFYYFQSTRHYFRSLRIALWCVLSLVLPLIVLFAGLLGGLMLYFNVLAVNVIGLDLLLFLLCVLLFVALGFICLFFYGIYAPVTLLLVREDAPSFRVAFCKGVAIGWRGKWVFYRFWLCCGLKTLASLFTLGIAFVLFTYHRISIAYCALVQTQGDK